MSSLPEAWLRGTVDGIPEGLQPAAHALGAALEDVAAPARALTDEQLWLQPGGAASVGFHLLHLCGSTDRLFTYARGERLSEQQKATLAAERSLPDPRPSADELLAHWAAVVDRSMRQLAATPEDDLGTARSIGRAGLPSSVRGVLWHAAEHATRHAGQIITTSMIIRGLPL